MTSLPRFENEYALISIEHVAHESPQMVPDELARKREYRLLDAQGPVGQLAVTYAMLYQEYIVRRHGQVIHDDLTVDDTMRTATDKHHGLSSPYYLG